MAARLAHRGPDGSGRWAEGPAALAHRMRKVAPTSSVQPLITPDAVVMLDGWIYDHLDVLQRAGGAPVGPDVPDTVALLSAWRAWGVELAAELDGEFSAAIWDRRQERLVLARGRMGTRPLFFTRKGQRTAFASELPALLTLPWVSRDIAPEQLAEYLEFQVIHSPRTLLRDVRQVEPAHTLVVDRGGERYRQYWQIRWADPDARQLADVDLLDGLQEAVDRAVARRVPPGAATGVYLSGGLGSTAVAVAARARFLTVPTFTVSFADDPNPESPFAGRVARLLGLENRELVVGTADLAAAFEPTVAALGGPIGHPAAMLQLLLARDARSRVRVVLSGDGGDELFGGRFLDRLVQGLGVARVIARMPGPLRRMAEGALGRTSWGRFAGPVASWLPALGVGGMGLFPTQERALLLRDPALVRPTVTEDVLGPLFAGVDTDPVNSAIHGVMRSALVESTLARADRTAAASGLEVRFPLLDRTVIERVAALPGALKIRRVGGTLHTRWVLRSLVSGAIPQALANRPQRGMPVPLDAWLAGPGRLFLEDRFARLKRDPFGLWRTGRLDELRAAAARPGPASRQLWSLFLLDAWMASL